jgi:hypothetical protein
MTDSVYEALNAARQEIRLATLLAGSFEDDIQVTLSTFPLSKELRYEALSYVWGNPNVTRPITLNGHTFELTTNLDAAIKHLRFQDRIESSGSMRSPSTKQIPTSGIRRSSLCETSIRTVSAALPG